MYNQISFYRNFGLPFGSFVQMTVTRQGDSKANGGFAAFGEDVVKGERRDKDKMARFGMNGFFATFNHPAVRVKPLSEYRHLVEEHILGAVNRGNYYCSSGVELDEIVTRDDGITLAIVPREGVCYTTRFIGTPIDTSSEAVGDPGGREVRTTRAYSEEIGKVLHETASLTPSYTFTGNELYVRAVVTSDVAHPNPTGPQDCEKAWTQPVVPVV